MRKEKVADVEAGTVCRYNGEWGVLDGRRFSRWIGKPIRLRPTDVVEVPARRLPPAGGKS